MVIADSSQSEIKYAFKIQHMLFHYFWDIIVRRIRI